MFGGSTARRTRRLMWEERLAAARYALLLQRMPGAPRDPGWAARLCGRGPAMPTPLDTPFRSGPSEGVVCGCHRPGCQPCRATGGCGWESCRSCRAFGYLGDAPPPAPLDVAWGVEGVEGSLDLARFERGIRQLGPPTTEAVRPTTRDLVDVHAHNFTTASVVDQAERIDLLVSMRPYARALFMMGEWDGSLKSDSQVSDSWDINRITGIAARLQPGFLLPFVKIRHDDWTGAGNDPEAMVEYWVGRQGFRGIGEVYAHTYGEELDNDMLLEVFKKASGYGIPVSVHWNAGSVDSSSTVSASDNRIQFLELVAALQSEWACPNIILCHCGAGPDPEDAADFADYQAFILLLLTEPAFEKVYFDLAGMQVGAETGEKQIWNLYDPLDRNTRTDLGDFIRDMIQVAPHRFLVASDIDNASAADWTDRGGNVRIGVDNYIASYTSYETFLESADNFGNSLSDAELELVMWRNALRVLRAFG